MNEKTYCQMIMRILTEAFGETAKVISAYPQEKTTVFCKEPVFLVQTAHADENAISILITLQSPMRDGSQLCETRMQKAIDSLQAASNFQELKNLSREELSLNESTRAYCIKTAVSLQRTITLQFGASSVLRPWSDSLQISHALELKTIHSPIIGAYVQNLGRRNRVLSVQGSDVVSEYANFYNLYLSNAPQTLTVGPFSAYMLFSEFLITEMNDTRMAYRLTFSEVNNR